ncbi:hypothetical protein IPF86_02655 [Candidatus Nomurabacteria bacterium]|nr:MAG: hypothetical protein IPF86_02655 [Candidatus Nomurabacteria bacterium]
MGKPVIFLDFDGFKFDTLDAHVEYQNYRYGINSTRADYVKNPSLDTVINKYLSQEKQVTSRDVYVDSVENFLTSLDWHKNVKPVDGMCEVMSKLTLKYKLVTVTAREKNGLAVIQHFLDTYIPNCVSEIHCVWEHAGNGIFNAHSKRDFIKNYSGKKVAFLDDSDYEILELQDIILSYLFDPLGTHDDNKKILHRVRSWEEIGKLFL